MSKLESKLIPLSAVFLVASCTLSKLPQWSRFTTTQFPAAAQEAKERHNFIERYQLLKDVEDWHDELYQDKNFAKIETFIHQSLAKERQDELASAYLTRLYGALGDLPTSDYRYKPEDEQHFERQKEILDQWIATRIKSHIPLLVRGILLYRYGWEIRSAALANKVPVEAWPQFHQYLHQAQKDLEQAAALNPKDPNVWSSLIVVARGLSHAQQEWEYFYQQGLAANPHHIGLQSAKLITFLPQWQGSRREMLAFARACNVQAKGADKPLMSTIMLGAFREIDEKEDGYLHQPEVWTEIEDIYRHIFAKYPNFLRFRFYYAYDAYQAERYAEALQQFETIGNRWANGTPWKSLTKFHRSRSHTYHQVAYNAYQSGDYQRAEALALKSVELLPTASAYLLLGAISGNIHHDLTRTIQYARQALGSDPTAEERQYAENMIHLAKKMQLQMR